MDDANPYRSLPDAAFWRPAVAERDALAIAGLWRPKFAIGRETPVITAGSCFAQHIGRALKAAGYSWLDAEPAPALAAPELARAFNYGVFSFRTGNIYTPALLRQWLSWALGESEPPAEVWREEGRVFDPFRPAIEPDGFASVEEMQASRRTTLRAIRRAVETSGLFVFTLGLTECWEGAGGVVYPMCPGVIAGRHDASAHRFANHAYPRVTADMEAAIALMRRANPGLKVLLTVSPVPLTATASRAHVLAATTYSKATLRAAAGDLAAADPTVDYFPSYELITGAPFRSRFFEPNLRSVSAEGVAFVMRSFFAALGADASAAGPGPAPTPAEADFDDDELVCEEEILALAR